MNTIIKNLIDLYDIFKGFIPFTLIMLALSSGLAILDFIQYKEISDLNKALIGMVCLFPFVISILISIIFIMSDIIIYFFEKERYSINQSKIIISSLKKNFFFGFFIISFLFLYKKVKSLITS